MSDHFKYNDLEENLPDTAEDFYTPPKAQEIKKTAMTSLLVTLNSKKTELKSLLIQRNSICQRMNEIDVKVGKLSIANQYLLSESDNLTVKNGELFACRKEFQSDLKDWNEAVACLKLESSKSEQEIRQRKGYIAQLMKKEQEFRQKIKLKQLQYASIQNYNFDLQGQIQQLDAQFNKKKTQRNDFFKMATTLQTFSKAFKKNIIQKQKEISRMKFQATELEGFIVTKTFQKGNIGKQIEKSDWECKMYLHHNAQISKTNEQLKLDLEKLMKHLQSLKKSSKHLNACIQQYSQTGVAAAKKILIQSNK